LHCFKKFGIYLKIVIHAWEANMMENINSDNTILTKLRFLDALGIYGNNLLKCHGLKLNEKGKTNGNDLMF